MNTSIKYIWIHIRLSHTLNVGWIIFIRKINGMETKSKRKEPGWNGEWKRASWKRIELNQNWGKNFATQTADWYLMSEFFLKVSPRCCFFLALKHIHSHSLTVSFSLHSALCSLLHIVRLTVGIAPAFSPRLFFLSVSLFQFNSCQVPNINSPLYFAAR